VLAIFDPQTVQRVQLLINALGSGTTNNGQNMNAQASSANQLVSALNGPAIELSVRQQQVQDIVLELQKFYGVLANQRVQVRDEFGTWNQVMGQLANQESSISGTIQQADLLLQSLDTLVTGEGSNITALLNQLPAALDQTNRFLDQSNTIINGIAPYRRAIGDVFPDLQTSFADTFKDPQTGILQHFWSVFSVNCNAGSNGCNTGAAPSAYQVSPSNVWAAMASSGGVR
jgi:ABC-type transporter Mla subunit MlaD